MLFPGNGIHRFDHHGEYVWVGLLIDDKQLFTNNQYRSYRGRARGFYEHHIAHGNRSRENGTRPTSPFLNLSRWGARHSASLSLAPRPATIAIPSPLRWARMQMGRRSEILGSLEPARQAPATITSTNGGTRVG